MSSNPSHDLLSTLTLQKSDKYFRDDVHPEIVALIEKANTAHALDAEDAQHLTVRNLRDGTRDRATNTNIDKARSDAGPQVISDLEEWMQQHVSTRARKYFKLNSVLRWMLRGLSIDKALARERHHAEALVSGISRILTATTQGGDNSQISKFPVCAHSECSDMFTPIDEFCFTSDQVTAIRRPFDQALERLNTLLLSKPISSDFKGTVYVASEPTGMGKSHAAAQAIADAALSAALDIRNHDMPTTRTIIVVVPTFALASGPMRTLNDELQRRGEDTTLLDSIDVVMLSGNDRLIDSHGVECLPYGCPVRKDKAATEAIVGYKKARADGKTSRPNPDPLRVATMSLVDTACQKGFIHGHGSPCAGCTFRNPGGVAYKQAGSKKPVTVVFLTYDKLLYGLSRLNRDEAGNFKRERLTLNGRTCFPPTTFIFEEAVEGFQKMWAHIIEHMSKVDIIAFAEHVVMHVGVLNEMPAFGKRWSKRSFRDKARIARAEEFMTTMRVVIEDEVLQYRNRASSFYVSGGNGVRIMPYGDVTALARVRMVIDPDNSHVGRFFQSTDLAFSSLSRTMMDGKHVTYEAEEEGSMCTVQIGAGYANGQDVALLVSAYVMHLVRPFVMMVSRLQHRISRNLADDPALAAAMHGEFDATVMRLLGETRSDMHEAMRGMLAVEASRQRTGSEQLGVTYLDASERLRVAGYSMVRLNYQEHCRLYQAMQENAISSPEGMVERLTQAGSDVLLVSATVDYPNPMETFSMDFFQGRGMAPVRPEPVHREHLLSAMSAKYEGRAATKFEVVEHFLHRRKGGPWDLYTRAPLSSLLREFLMTRILSGNILNIGEDTSNEHHPATVLLRFLESVLAEPGRPRMSVVLVNSLVQSKCLNDICMAFKEFIKDTPCAGMDIIIREERSSAADQTTKKGVEFADAMRVFQDMLLDRSRAHDQVPVMIVLAPRQSMGVGANLQLRFSRDVLERSLPPLLSAYMGDVLRLRAFQGAKDVQVDISDMLLCVHRTYVIDDKTATKTMMTLTADGSVDPSLLRHQMGSDARAVTAFLKPTAVFAGAHAMTAIQNVGRMDRSLNAPSGITLWVNRTTADYVGVTPDAVMLDGQPLYATPNFVSFVQKMRHGRPDQSRVVQANDLSAKLRTLALMLLLPANPLPVIDELWNLLRKIGVEHSAVSERFFSTPEAVACDALISTVRMLVTDGSPILTSLRDMYMRCPISVFRDCTLKPATMSLDGFASKGNIAFLRAHAGECDDYDVVTASPALLKEEWRLGLCGLSRWTAGEGDVTGEEAVHVMRPAAMKEVAVAALDECRTRAFVRQVPGVGGGALPYELNERCGDHMFLNPGFLVDNKAHAKGRYLGHDGPQLITQMVESGHRKLDRCMNWHIEQGRQSDAPTVLVYVFRHDLRGMENEKATFRAIKSDTKETLHGQARVDADIILMSMPRDWSVEPFEELVKLVRFMVAGKGNANGNT